MWLFDTSGYVPRWQSGEWTRGLGWLSIGSDAAISVAAIAFSVVLGVVILSRRARVPRVAWLFVALLASWGIGHLLNVVVFWVPAYRLATVWNVVTACLTCATLLALVPLVPRILQLPSLELANQRLKDEMTAREAAERELSATNRLLSFQKHALDEHAIVAITDHTGTITYVNDKFCEISGYGREQLIGQTHRVVNSGEHPKSFFVEMWKTICAGQVWRGEICNRASDGRRYWVDTTIVPLTGADGRPTQYVAIRADVTARKTYEEQLAHTVEALRTKSAELDRKNKELEQFTYSASHDLKSPLVTILGYCECIAEDVAKHQFDDLDGYVKRILSKVEQMRSNIDDLLALSRIGRLEDAREHVPLAAVVDEVLDLFAARVEEAGVEIVRSIEAESVFAPHEQVKQVMQNLIENALRYGVEAEHPRIEIGSATREASVEIWVQDNGQGIPPEYHESVFRLFKRLETRSEGTGVGLAIVKRVAETHRGRAWVESTPGQGACFRVIFPFAQTSLAEDAPSGERTYTTGPISPHRG
ncbi:MAG: PAS domain S-box protein [Phycisphaerales bacterium]|nr:PAS domain S-box protein [Phycisphaerales bacterium]